MLVVFIIMTAKSYLAMGLSNNHVGICFSNCFRFAGVRVIIVIVSDKINLEIAWMINALFILGLIWCHIIALNWQIHWPFNSYNILSWGFISLPWLIPWSFDGRWCQEKYGPCWYVNFSRPWFTTACIVGTDSETTESNLREAFCPFGEILSISIQCDGRGGKYHAFILFESYGDAKDAIDNMHMSKVGSNLIKCGIASSIPKGLMSVIWGCHLVGGLP